MRFVPTAGEQPGAHDQLWKTQSPASRGFGGGREDERVLGDAQSDGVDPAAAPALVRIGFAYEYTGKFLDGETGLERGT